MREWSLVGSRRAETLLSTSLHMVSDIHTFFRASLNLGFKTALRRSAKSPSSLVGVVRGWRGDCLILLRYLEYFLRSALRRHPRTKQWSKLYLGSRKNTLQKIRRSVPRI